MKLLNRNEILMLIEKEKILHDISNEIVENERKKYDKLKSCVQPSSLDLHIGALYLPETEESKKGGLLNPIEDGLGIKSGHTAMIRTKEKISLPNNIAGICFAPSRLTLKGIIVTNVGHVDPGYIGHLHFTVINMGKEDFFLRKDDVICTMLLIEIIKTEATYGEEHFDMIKGNKNDYKVPAILNRSLPKLARDFVNFNRRVKDVVDIRTKILKYGLPIVITFMMTLIITFVPPLLYNLYNPWNKKVIDVQSENEIIDNKIKDLNEKLGNLKGRILKLEKKKLRKKHVRK